MRTSPSPSLPIQTHCSELVISACDAGDDVLSKMILPNVWKSCAVPSHVLRATLTVELPSLLPYPPPTFACQNAGFIFPLLSERTTLNKSSPAVFPAASHHCAAVLRRSRRVVPARPVAAAVTGAARCAIDLLRGAEVKGKGAGKGTGLTTSRFTPDAVEVRPESHPLLSPSHAWPGLAMGAGTAPSPPRASERWENWSPEVLPQ